MPPCTCVICEDLPPGRDAAIVGHIREHGWSVLRIGGGEFEFAYTVGLWHTFRRPETVMFGLDGQNMQQWLNASVEVGQPADDEPFHGVIDGFETRFRAVHPDWHDPLFGTLYRVYHQEVPVRQLVWPDKNGQWPWEPEHRNRRQAQAWLPVAEHPDNGWRLVGELEPGFPFPVGPDSWALTTAAIVDGTRKPLWVLHDESVYDVLDERRYEADDLRLAYLGEIVRQHPHLEDCASVPDGHTATRQDRWTTAPAGDLDRHRSKKAWETTT